MNTIINKFVATLAVIAFALALVIVVAPLSHADDEGTTSDDALSTQSASASTPNEPVGGGIQGDVLPPGNSDATDISSVIPGSEPDAENATRLLDVGSSADMADRRTSSRVLNDEGDVKASSWETHNSEDTDTVATPQATGVDCATLAPNNDDTHIDLSNAPTADCETVNYKFNYNSGIYTIITSTPIEVTGSDNYARFYIESNLVNITLNNATLYGIVTYGVLSGTGESLNLIAIGTNSVSYLDISNLNITGSGTINLSNNLYIVNGNLEIGGDVTFAIGSSASINICIDGYDTCSGDLTIDAAATFSVESSCDFSGNFRNITNGGILSADTDIPYYGTLINSGSISGGGNLSKNAQMPIIEQLPSVDYIYGQGDGIVTLLCPATVSDGGVLTYQWTNSAGYPFSNPLDTDFFLNGTTSPTLVLDFRYGMEEYTTYGLSSVECHVTNTNNSATGTKEVTAVRNVFYLLTESEINITPNDVYILKNGSIPVVSTISYSFDNSKLVYGNSIDDVITDITWRYNCSIDVTSVSSYNDCIEIDNYDLKITGGYRVNFEKADVQVLEEAALAAINHSDPITGVIVSCVDGSAFCAELPATVRLSVTPKIDVLSAEYKAFLDELNAGTLPSGKQYAIHKLHDIKLINPDGSEYQPNISGKPTDVLVRIGLLDFGITLGTEAVHHKHGSDPIKAHEITLKDDGFVEFKTNQFSLFGVTYLTDAPGGSELDDEVLTDVTLDSASTSSLAATGTSLNYALLALFALLFVGAGATRSRWYLLRR